MLNEGVEEWEDSARDTFMDVSYDGGFEKKNDEGLVSTNDIEKLLEFQIEQMQSKFCAFCSSYPAEMLTTAKNSENEYQKPYKINSKVS